MGQALNYNVCELSQIKFCDLLIELGEINLTYFVYSIFTIGRIHAKDRYDFILLNYALK